MKLSELSIGSTATIQIVGGSGALRQHFLDMGLIQGTEVTVVKYAPMGDPIELRIHGYELSLTGNAVNYHNTAADEQQRCKIFKAQYAFVQQKRGEGHPKHRDAEAVYRDAADRVIFKQQPPDGKCRRG